MTTRKEFEVWYGGRNPEHIGYAWDAWQASRTAALEEAAKECEKLQSEALEDQLLENDERFGVYAKKYAKAASHIRALKD